MASGLPILYSNTGGIPELVGKEAGLPLHCFGSNDQGIKYPMPSDIAEGMIKVSINYKNMGLTARKRAIEKFDIKEWIDKHKEIFDLYIKR